jgi:putative ABC transport system permease protein
MEALVQDLRYALRTLARSPGFTLVAVLTLALGIGANTAVFSVLCGVLLRPLPYPEPDRLVQIAEIYRGSTFSLATSYSQFRFLDQHQPVFRSFAATTSVGFNLFAGGEAERVNGLRVSRDYFRTLGVAPQLGREFLLGEDQPGGPSVAILSHGLWERRFGGDPGAVGRVISLDGIPTMIVGVMPAGFHSLPPVDVWSTLAQVAHTIGSGQNLEVIGRLKPELTLQQAQAAMAPTLAAYREAFSRQGMSPEVGLELDSYQHLVAQDLHQPVQLVFGAIALVLLIACANVASLVLGRAAARDRELAVRVALGASGARLTRQLLTEGVLLTLLGGAAGLLFATWGLRALLSLAPAGFSSTAQIQLDRWALLFTGAVSLVTGVVFGLLPARQATRTDLHDTLREGAGRSTSPYQRSRLRSLLVIGEVALSVVLLAGGALLVRTFANLMRTDTGFDPDHVLSAEIWLTGSRYDSTTAIASFYGELTRRLDALPGVDRAAVVEAGLPLVRGGNLPVQIDGEYHSTDYRTVTPGYFAALGIPLLEGRVLAAADREHTEPVVVVNRTFAHRYMADSALGRSVKVGGEGGSIRRIVGVVGDVKSFVGYPTPPTVFITSEQTPASFTRVFSSWFPTHVVVRTAGDPRALRTALARAIHETDPEVPVGRIRSMPEVLASSLAVQRFVMTLLAAFAGLALVLATVGLYGVMSYLVTQRTHEIGVRMALGAEPGQVLGMVLRRGMLLAAIGLGVGLVGAVFATRLLESQLYDVKPADPMSLAAVVVLLAVVALCASMVPALRGTRVDPVVALRTE